MAAAPSALAGLVPAGAALAVIAVILLAFGNSALAESVPAAKGLTQGTTIARLDGQPISLEDVEAEIAFQVYRRQVDIYSLLKRATEELVERRLLAREATRRGLTVEELIQSEVDSGVAPVREEEVEAYFNEHPGDASQPNARERIRYYLEETRKIDRRLGLLGDLRARARFEFLIDPPEQPRVRLSVDGAPIRGAVKAPITLVHFATFSSRRSARSFGFISRLREEFPGKIRWIHRHFPNERDEAGLLAAQLAIQADQKGRFWEFHDRLFALEGRLELRDLEAARSALNLQPVAAGETTYLARVKRDIDSGVRAGITHEPVLFVNGRYFSGTFPYEKLRQMVEEELGEAAEGGRHKN